MLTIIYKSKKLSEINNLDYWPDLKVNFSVISKKTKVYETAFGSRYLWKHELVKVHEMFELRSFQTDEVTRLYAWAEITQEMKAFEFEAMIEIEKYLNTLNFRPYEA